MYNFVSLFRCFDSSRHPPAFSPFRSVFWFCLHYRSHILFNIGQLVLVLFSRFQSYGVLQILLFLTSATVRNVTHNLYLNAIHSSSVSTITPHSSRICIYIHFSLGSLAKVVLNNGKRRRPVLRFFFTSFNSKILWKNLVHLFGVELEMAFVGYVAVVVDVVVIGVER